MADPGAPNPDREQSAQQQSGEPEMVEVHQAEIADLDAALENAKREEAAEGGPALSDLSDDGSQAPAADDAPAPTPEPKPDGNQAQPLGAEPSKPANGAPQRVYTQEEVQGILADNERQKKEGNQKELFIQHRGTELGKLKNEYATVRSQLHNLRSQLMTGLEDRLSENPAQGLADRDRIKEIDTQLQGLDQQETRASGIVEAQTFFLRHVDTEKVSIDDVADVLRADGIGEQYIAQFKQNPWEFTSPEALVQFGRRAMDRMEFKTADSDRRILAKHVLQLNDQIARLRGQPNRVAAQIQRNLNGSPPVTSASAMSPNLPSEVDPTKMSIAQLDSAIQQAMRSVH